MPTDPIDYAPKSIVLAGRERASDTGAAARSTRDAGCVGGASTISRMGGQRSEASGTQRMMDGQAARVTGELAQVHKVAHRRCSGGGNYRNQAMDPGGIDLTTLGRGATGMWRCYSLFPAPFLSFRCEMFQRAATSGWFHVEGDGGKARGNATAVQLRGIARCILAAKLDGPCSNCRRRLARVFLVPRP